MTDVERWIEAGLYDPASPLAGGRLELLEYLAAAGVTIDEMLAANGEGELVAAAADKKLAVERTLTRAEAADRSGLTVAQIDRVWLAVGLTPPPAGEAFFSEGDIELLRSFALGSELFPFDGLLQFSRVLGASLARIAEAAVSGFLVNVQAPLAREGADPKALAEANSDAVDLLLALPSITDPLFRRLVWNAVRRTRISRDRDEYDIFRVTIGFLDLVGYTEWSQQLSSVDLAHAVNDFEQAASDLIINSGARVVKNIGDAVMFAADDAAVACRVGLELCRFVDEHATLTRLRAAVATGEVLARDGDYIGPTVNLAARLVKEAEPGTLVTNAPVDGHRCELLRTVDLRGIDAPVPLYRIT